MKIQEALEILMKIKLQFGDDLEIVVQSVDQGGYDDASIVVESLAERGETKRYDHEGLYVEQQIWGDQLPDTAFKNRVVFFRVVHNRDLIIQPEDVDKEEVTPIGIDHEALYRLWSGKWRYPGEKK